MSPNSQPYCLCVAGRGMAHWVTLQGTCGGEQAGEGFWWSISIVSVHSRVTKDLWLVPGIEDQNAAVPEVERGHGIDPVCVSAVRGEETHPVLPAGLVVQLQLSQLRVFAPCQCPWGKWLFP